MQRKKLTLGPAGRASSSTPHITVAVRVRPENEKELENNQHRQVIEVMDEHMICFDPSGSQMSVGKRNVLFGISGARPNNRLGPSKGISSNFHRARDQKYAFDYVFDKDAQQHEVYDKTARPLIEPVLNGFNATVFAYGATGSGKTHTMIGDESAAGVMVLTMRDLFQRVDECKHEKQIKISMSYLEVYNETIRDLLVDSSPDLMLLDNGNNVTVKGLSVRFPESANSVFEMLREGNARRSQSPTEANANSSRSHAVLQIMIEQRDRTGNVSAAIQVGKLSLIDLAGSERASVTQNRGDRMREGANINKSLLALGNCINSLGEHFKKGKHIPYRNSKLTRLLKDSLGGNCRTVMIANVSPSNLSYDDSLNTLKYANRAKNIKLTLHRNVVNVNYHVKEYTRIISELRVQVKELEDHNKLLTREAPTQISSNLALKYSMDLEDKKNQLNRAFTVIAELRDIIKEQYEMIVQNGLVTSRVLSNFSRANELAAPEETLKQSQVWAPVHPSPEKTTADPLDAVSPKGTQQQAKMETSIDLSHPAKHPKKKRSPRKKGRSSTSPKSTTSAAVPKAATLTGQGATNQKSSNTPQKVTGTPQKTTGTPQKTGATPQKSTPQQTTGNSNTPQKTPSSTLTTGKPLTPTTPVGTPLSHVTPEVHRRTFPRFQTPLMTTPHHTSSTSPSSGDDHLERFSDFKSRVGHHHFETPPESPVDRGRATVCGVTHSELLSSSTSKLPHTPKQSRNTLSPTGTPAASQKTTRPRSILKRTSAPSDKPRGVHVMFAGLSPKANGNGARSPLRGGLAAKSRASPRKSPFAQKPLRMGPSPAPAPPIGSSSGAPVSVFSKPQRLARLMEPTFASNQRLSKTPVQDKENTVQLVSSALKKPPQRALRISKG